MTTRKRLTLGRRRSSEYAAVRWEARVVDQEVKLGTAAGVGTQSAVLIEI